jgi:hypothetical protein
MEKDTITIEIKQEVSITLLWIVAGVILVSLAFLLAPRSTELWLALNVAGIVAAVYLITLLFFVLKKPLSTKLRATVGIVAAVVMGCSAFTWTRMEDRTHWQAAKVMEIRARMGRGIMSRETPAPLVKTLAAYHQQGPKKKKTLGAVFREFYGGAGVGSNIYKPKWEGDPLTIIIVETLDSDRIVLVSQETYVKGRDPDFRNLDGRIGMVQEKFILTEKGITHVSEN